MSVRTVVPGSLVAKSAQAIPNSTFATLYTVSGGNVLVTGLLGVVSTTLASTASLTLGLASGDSSIMTGTTLANNVAGTWIMPVGSAGKATTGVLARAVFVQAPPFIVNPFVVGAGTIVWQTSAAATGAVTWYLWYVPLDLDAAVS